VTHCDVIYVVLGVTAEDDQLVRCTLDLKDCWDHPIQLDWIRADPDRLAAYNDQLRRYDVGQQIGAQVEQESLL
jgi:hypothetical protein